MRVELLERADDAFLVDKHEERPLLGEIVRRARKRGWLRDVRGWRLGTFTPPARPERMHVCVLGRGHVARAASRAVYHGRGIAEL